MAIHSRKLSMINCIWKLLWYFLFYSYETSDGTKHDQLGTLKDAPLSDDKAIDVIGSYEFTSDDGKTYRVDYTSGVNVNEMFWNLFFDISWLIIVFRDTSPRFPSFNRHAMPFESQWRENAHSSTAKWNYFINQKLKYSIKHSIDFLSVKLNRWKYMKWPAANFYCNFSKITQPCRDIWSA